MSIAKMVEVWDTTTKSCGERLVLLALADAANDDGTCYPSAERLGKKAGLGERQVRKHLTALEERGLVSRTRRRRSDGSLGTYLYHVLPPELEDTTTGTRVPLGDESYRNSETEPTGTQRPHHRNSDVPPTGTQTPRVIQREPKERTAAPQVVAAFDDSVVASEVAKAYYDKVKADTGHQPPEAFLAIRAIVLGAVKAEFSVLAIKRALVALDERDRPLTRQTLWAEMIGSPNPSARPRPIREDPNELLDRAREAVESDE